MAEKPCDYGCGGILCGIERQTQKYRKDSSGVFVGAARHLYIRGDYKGGVFVYAASVGFFSIGTGYKRKPKN